MSDQSKDNPIASVGVGPRCPSAGKQCDLVQRMDWNPEALAIQSPALRLNDGKIVGPNSVDKQRLIDSPAEPDGANDECDEWSDHGSVFIKGSFHDAKSAC